jgi:hypothetical protein
MRLPDLAAAAAPTSDLVSPGAAGAAGDNDNIVQSLGISCRKIDL